MNSSDVLKRLGPSVKKFLIRRVNKIKEDVLESESSRLYGLIDESLNHSIMSDVEREAVKTVSIHDIEYTKRIASDDKKLSSGERSDFVLKRMEYGNRDRVPSKPIFRAIMRYRQGRHV